MLVFFTLTVIVSNVRTRLDFPVCSKNKWY